MAARLVILAVTVMVLRPSHGVVEGTSVNTGSGTVLITVSGTSIVWVPPANKALNCMTADSFSVTRGAV